MNEHPDERTINETPITEVIDRPLGGKSNLILDSQIFSSIMNCPRLTDFRFNHNFISIGGWPIGGKLNSKNQREEI